MYPPAFVERLKEQDYISVDDFLQSLSKKPITSIRFHPEKKRKLAFPSIEKISWSENGFYLSERPVFTLDPHFHAGAYYVQDASSQFLEIVLNQLKPNLPENPKILDLCAAPGGKSTHILSWLNHSGLLVTNEVIQTRVKILHENIVKWGYSNVVVTNSDPKAFRQIEHFFDVIVIDAPCSGEGLFRKDANAMEEWSENNCNLCASRQKRIVTDALESLKPGGFLIYSTCTFNPAENEENADFFSEELLLKNIPIVHQLENEVTTIVSAEKNDGYSFLPNKVNGEGFYITCFQKQGEAELYQHTSKKKKETKGEQVPEQLYTYLNTEKEHKIIPFLDNYYAIPVENVQDFENLKNKVKIYAAGIEMGHIKGKNFVPNHALSQSLFFRKEAFPSISLDIHNALRFLKKIDMELPSDLESGWYLAEYEGSVLGFLKK